MVMKGIFKSFIFFFSLFCFVSLSAFSQQTKSLYKDTLHPDPWSLIISRPESTPEMNDIRCYLKVLDAETKEDVTYTKIKANYAWLSSPKNGHNYQHTYYLDGGMSMHLLLKPGKYIISFYTPKDKVFGIKVSNKEDWISNDFYYDTDNPANVIWIIPTANDNGFYNGGWFITHKAPEYFKFVKPRVTDN